MEPGASILRSPVERFAATGAAFKTGGIPLFESEPRPKEKGQQRRHDINRLKEFEHLKGQCEGGIRPIRPCPQ